MNKLGIRRSTVRLDHRYGQWAFYPCSSVDPLRLWVSRGNQTRLGGYGFGNVARSDPVAGCGSAAAGCTFATKSLVIDLSQGPRSRVAKSGPVNLRNTPLRGAR